MPGGVDDDVDPAERCLDRVERPPPSAFSSATSPPTAIARPPAALIASTTSSALVLVAGVVHGDGACRRRRAARRLTRPMPPEPPVTIATALLWRGHGVLLLELRDVWRPLVVVGPVRLPMPGPPWHQPCRGSLSRRYPDVDDRCLILQAPAGTVDGLPALAESAASGEGMTEST